MKKIVIFIIVVILIAGGAVWFWHSRNSKVISQPGPVVSTNNANESTTTGATMTKVDPSQLPNQFPTDVPTEPGATITLNANATNATGQFQATREFISKKSADENFTYYQTLLKQNGWTVTSALDDTSGNQKIILATKAANNLNIRIYTTNGQVRVSMSNIVNK